MLQLRSSLQFTHQPWLYAFYSAAFEGSSRAYLASIIPATEKASAIGLRDTLVGAMLFPASALFGFLWQGVSPAVAFFSGSGLAFGALVLFAVVRQGATIER